MIYRILQNLAEDPLEEKYSHKRIALSISINTTNFNINLNNVS
jgi:hypothetical protein